MAQRHQNDILGQTRTAEEFEENRDLASDMGAGDDLLAGSETARKASPAPMETATEEYPSYDGAAYGLDINMLSADQLGMLEDDFTF
jgi:hypothetical protein